MSAASVASAAPSGAVGSQEPSIDIESLIKIVNTLRDKGVSESDPKYAALLKLLKAAHLREAELAQNAQPFVPQFRDVSHGITAPPTGVDPSTTAGLQTPAAQQQQQQQLQKTVLAKPMTYPWLVQQRDASVRVRMQHRLAQLQELLAAPGLAQDSQERRQLEIELKSLQLYELQRTLRASVASDMHRLASSNAAGRPNAFRRIRKFSTQPDLIPMLERSDRQRQLDLTMSRKKRHRDFINSVLRHAQEFKTHHQNNLVQKQKFNKAMMKWHVNKEKREAALRERKEKERLSALKRDNEEEYIKMLQETKNERLLSLLAQTDDYLRQIAELVDQQQEREEEEALEEQIRGQGVDPAKIEALQQALNQRREAAAKAAERRMEVSADATSQANREMRATYYAKIHRVGEEIKEQPSILLGGKLKEYQMDGLTWLISLYNNKLNGILADEMGLGKTIQTIALLAYLKEKKKVEGPFLVVAPLSTISNWANEFAKWCPALKTVVYKGSPAVRKSLTSKMASSVFNVCLTTFDFILKDKAALTRFRWKYIIVDEGHRMKNHNCKLTQTLQKHYTSGNRIILTGTPLQNSLPELWSLLNFLLPNIFNSSDSFETWFNQPFAQAGEKVEMNEEESLLVIKRLHKVLRPFLLRRLKTQVEAQLPDKTEKVLKCEMSAMQKVMYKSLSETGAIQVQAVDGKHAAKSMMNIMVQLRKICNHPYLFNEQMQATYELDDTLWRASGKFELLDRILPKLKAAKHRVLMFSQMTATMNLMEDYFRMREYKYLRLDGGVKADDRGDLLRDFNAPDSPYFIFILSTRAGGLGLNLQTADTVILFDSDWNPQADLQAQDRAHRIGQKNHVLVLRLCTINSIEERVLERANYKLDMDQKIIEAGMFHKNASAEDRRTFLMSLLKQGQEEGERLEEVPGDKEINDMLARSPEEYYLFQQMDKYREANEKKDAETRGLPAPRPRLIPESELPAWLLVDANKEKAIKQEKAIEDYGRGRRKRNVTTYADISDEQFEQFLEETEGIPDPESNIRASIEAQQHLGEANDDMDVDDSASVASVGPDGVKKRKRDSETKEEKLKKRQEYAAQMQAVWLRLIDANGPTGRKVCELFMEEPDPAENAEYYQVVGDAISMGDVAEKIRTLRYKRPADMYEDILRICRDAKLYSDNPESDWNKNATALEELVDREFASAGLDKAKRSKKMRRMNEPHAPPPAAGAMVARAAFGEEPNPFPMATPASTSAGLANVAPGAPRVAAAAFGGAPADDMDDDNPFPSDNPFPPASTSASSANYAASSMAAPAPQQQQQQQQQFAAPSNNDQGQPAPKIKIALKK